MGSEASRLGSNCSILVLSRHEKLHASSHNDTSNEFIPTCPSAVDTGPRLSLSFEVSLICAAKMTVGWSDTFNSAQAALKEGKFFDGVQAINACMEAYAKVVGDESDRVLRDPPAFLEEYKAKLTEEQKDVLRKMRRRS